MRIRKEEEAWNSVRTDLQDRFDLLSDHETQFKNLRKDGDFDQFIARLDKLKEELQAYLSSL